MLNNARTAGHWIMLGLVFVAVLELCARIEDAVRWDAPIIGSYAHSMLWVHDSLGFRNRPGAHFEKWRLNSHGFRGPEVAVATRPGVTRVGVLGASETFGLFESANMEYPAQLRATLDRRAPGTYEVVNFAVAGMGLPTMRGYYDRVVAPFAPDVVYVYPSPSFYLDTAPPTEIEPRTGPVEAGLPLDVTPRIGDRTATMLKRFVPVGLQERVKAQRIDRVRDAHGAAWVWEDVPEDRMELFRRDLTELVSTIQASGADVVLMTHTNRFAGRASLTPDDRFHLHNIISLFPRASDVAVTSVDNAANPIIIAVARQLGADLLDIGALIPGSSEHFADYSHFTDAGAARVAELMATHLMRPAGQTASH